SDTIANWPVPATGTWLLGIRGTAAGATGLYDLSTKAKAAPNPAPVTGALLASKIDDVSFDALAGTKATFTLKRPKGSSLVPRFVEIVGPDGATVPLTGSTRKSTATSDSLKNVLLPAFGAYKVRVQGDAGSA